MLSTSILRSVGVGGVNRPEDVRTIQSLLNLIPAVLGGPFPQLIVDGLCGPKTNGSIYGFQRKHFGPAGADGRVDPGQQTLQKIIELLNGLGPNPPGTTQFSGFNAQQTATLQRAIRDARAICDNAISLTAIAFAMKEPNRTVTSLRHNFDIDIKAEAPHVYAFESAKLLMLQRRLATLRAALQEDVPFVYEPTPGFPEAWVVGVDDPTVHIKPSFFDDGFKTDLSRAATILHERAHTALKAPGHPGILDGGGLATMVVDAHVDKRPLYRNRARFFDDALMNPYNYEWLCVSIDSRYAPMGAGGSGPTLAMRMSCGCGSMA